MGYTVILVEDEKIVRDELAASIGWERLGLTLVGTAADGLEGEAMIKKLDPDIVITDIRLPGIDGLTMLARCPVNHAIVLSGHTDFSYMKQAIRLGVFDYLLKPVDDDELETTLSNLVVKLREEDVDYERLRKTKNATGEELIPLPHSVNNHVVDNAISFIATNYGKPVGLQEAATFLGLSESHLSRLFKEVTGLNFLQYLNAWRINKSVELMRDPKRNIGEIATSCGFPTPGYFAKIFKRFSGVTPTQYRDEHPSI
ncbi:MAG: helix-turn-helix domain-containing protein [Sphaerochaeta sp.]|jgi:two-component system response regulator YesN|nr:helix-turn-helix domain-containing protein [Sphaerochaeta sp.]MCI2045806.1 helix-turn-helix domain-containing protein [Sphaerochaeta sp.]MCI2097162.1 helix-turn-helix domain-containing protein [Sphaerochaeta sp.]